MKKISVSKLLACIIVIAMTLSLLAACGPGGNEGGTEASTEQPATSGTTGDNQTTTEQPAAEGNQEQYTFSIFGNMAPEMTDADRAFFAGVEEALNVTIDIMTPPTANYDEALQLLLASGDWADLMLFGSHNSPMFMNAVRDGVFLPVDEYIANAPNLMAYSYEISWDTLRVLAIEDDNRIWGIPRTSIARADGWLIRQDWLDNLGIDWWQSGEEMTLEQFETILEAFTTQDPDGDGINNTFGIGYVSFDGFMDPQLGPAFDVSGWRDYDGYVMDLRVSQERDNYKNLLEWNNRMWESGFVDPDWPTMGVDVWNERFERGISGIKADFAGWLTNFQDNGRQLNPDFNLSYIPRVVLENGQHYYAGGFGIGFWGCWTIASTMEQPERGVEFLDFLLSDAWWNNTKYGLEGFTWNWVDGEQVPTDLYGTHSFTRNIVRRNNDPGFFVSINQTAEERAEIERYIDICIRQYSFTLDQGFRPPAADEPRLIDADTILRTTTSRIVAGDLPVSAWDAALADWYEAGGADYVQQMQDFIRDNR